MPTATSCTRDAAPLHRIAAQLIRFVHAAAAQRGSGRQGLRGGAAAHPRGQPVVVAGGAALLAVLKSWAFYVFSFQFVTLRFRLLPLASSSLCL